MRVREVGEQTRSKMSQIMRERMSDPDARRAMREVLRDTWLNKKSPLQRFSQMVPALLKGRPESEKAAQAILEVSGFYVWPQWPSRYGVHDLFLPMEQIVIEIDGPGHDEIVYRQYDEERDRLLKENYGIETIRISPKEVEEHAYLLFVMAGCALPDTPSYLFKRLGSQTITSALSGDFREDSKTREEFLRLAGV